MAKLSEIWGVHQIVFVLTCQLLLFSPFQDSRSFQSRLFVIFASKLDSTLKAKYIHVSFCAFIAFWSNQVVGFSLPHPSPTVGVEVNVVEGEALLAWFNGGFW